MHGAGVESVFTPNLTPPKPGKARGKSKLSTARESITKRRALLRRLRRVGIGLAVVVAALVVLWLLFLVLVHVLTTNLWFDSVHAGSVYHTALGAQVLLFCVFGVIAGAIGGVTLLSLRRIRPRLVLSPEDDTFRWIFRKYERRIWPLLLILAILVPGIVVGSRAANAWQTYELWRHVKPWHSQDSLFHKDVSFYIGVYPFHRLVASLLTQSVTYALWIALIGGYWFGAWRLRRNRRKITRGMTRLLSLLGAAYLVLKAVNFWLSRYALLTSSRGPVTGASYTDVHAGLPGKYVLMSISIVVAVFLLVNGILAGRLLGRFRMGRVRALALAAVVMIAFTAIVGSAWTGLLYHFGEAPSAAKVDLGEISRNQQATLSAFGLDGDVTTIPYTKATSTDTTTLTDLANSTSQPSVIDPNQLSPTFNVEQQIQAYYGFKSTLDIGNYNLNGTRQDVAIAVRELQSAGIPKSSWVNNHLVYTHGYGVVAAPTGTVDPVTNTPDYLDGGMPPSQEIPVSRPQVYFGQAFGNSSYSIVGQPSGSTKNLEFDHPGGNGSSTSAHTTYQGSGGIPIGSTWRRLLFAVSLHDPNVLFSSEINGASQLLTVRNPRARVAKVAPWLTLDGDVYPAVVNGHIKWIVDGYTSSSNYPDSQEVNLRNASKTTLTTNGASIQQPSRSVNYLRNSVKAVVDAYTGQVTLYSWNQQSQPDPLLQSWESVFPGLVKPQSSIPAALLSQLRYPTDLFNVQRTLLAKYHVAQPQNFYSGNDFWTVPSDPTVTAVKSINANGSGSSSSAPPQPSRYMSMSADGTGTERYALSTPMVTLNGRQLAAFISVDSVPGPDYGKFTVLEYPSTSDNESPSQVQNDIESDTSITEALTLQRGGNSRVVLGDLEAIPVGGRILYVEPVYTQSKTSGSFPILRHVIALYGNGDPSFENTLSQAIKVAIRSGVGTG